jgi:hypothetical protein
MDWIRNFWFWFEEKYVESQIMKDYEKSEFY